MRDRGRCRVSVEAPEAYGRAIAADNPMAGWISAGACAASALLRHAPEEDFPGRAG